MQVVLVSADLMLLSAVQHEAERRGGTMAVVSPGEAAETCAATGARLLVADLRHPSLEIAPLTASVRATCGAAAWILACAPHVHEASLAAATAAGCDEVVTRGEFPRRLAATISRLEAESRPKTEPGDKQG